VPAGTPAKSTGLIHMALNVTALLVFAINAFQQWPQRVQLVPQVGFSVLLSVLGVCLTVAAGIFGWKLVQTHHVGVDLTPEQERFEPRGTPPVERERPMPGSHGRPVT